MWFFNKKSEQNKWEDTENGKRFSLKYSADFERRIKEKEEWEKNTPPEIKEQVKLFKIFFTLFFIPFGFILMFAFDRQKELIALFAFFIIALVSFLFFLIKPKKIKYPNCFMMPVIAFGCICLFYFFLGFKYGFNPDKRNEKILPFLKVSQNIENNSVTPTYENNIDDSAYLQFLIDNEIVSLDEAFEIQKKEEVLPNDR